MRYKELVQEALKYKSSRPDLWEEIKDLLILAHSEIEQGESEEHECELAWSDIKDLAGGVTS